MAAQQELRPPVVWGDASWASREAAAERSRRRRLPGGRGAAKRRQNIAGGVSRRNQEHPPSHSPEGGGRTDDVDCVDYMDAESDAQPPKGGDPARSPGRQPWDSVGASLQPPKRGGPSPPRGIGPAPRRGSRPPWGLWGGRRVPRAPFGRSGLRAGIARLAGCARERSGASYGPAGVAGRPANGAAGRLPPHSGVDQLRSSPGRGPLCHMHAACPAPLGSLTNFQRPC